ncbi:MAG: hypothetical protein K2F99_02905, partial [Muribaculaceae bacterium]|nr:hypothetical protein [Muribaculaceae bacterium]
MYYHDYLPPSRDFAPTPSRATSPDRFTSLTSHPTTMRRTSRILCRRQRYRLSRDYAADFA